jgi:hypothetical protein
MPIVESIPEDFKTVQTEYGPSFHCGGLRSPGNTVKVVLASSRTNDPGSGTNDPGDSWLLRKGPFMMIYQEKIAPPLPIRLTDDEQIKVIAEAVAEEDRWVKDFIDRLAGLVRDLKH